MSESIPAGLDCWAIVELFGHQKIAGKVTEQTVAGTAMLRVDVPEVSEQPAFTRFFGHGAIYSINPTTEQIVRGVAESVRAVPIARYELPSEPKRLSAPEDEAEDEYEEEEA